MKRSKRYIKKQQKKSLINKKVLQRIIRESNLCQYAIRELKLAGYGKGAGGPNDWIYQQVLEAVAVFTSHGNSGTSAPFEINLVQKLCSFDVISPLKFTDDEWNKISYCNDEYQNNRKSNIFKDPDGTICDVNAFNNRPTKKYSYSTKEWTDSKNLCCYSGGLFEFEDGVFTGRYFNRCNLFYFDIHGDGYMPKKPITIDCVEIEVSKDDWIMAVDTHNANLLILSTNYDIQWLNCPCLKGVHLEDMTGALEELAYIEIKNS